MTFYTILCSSFSEKVGASPEVACFGARAERLLPSGSAADPPLFQPARLEEYNCEKHSKLSIPSFHHSQNNGETPLLSIPKHQQLGRVCFGEARRSPQLGTQGLDFCPISFPFT